MRSNNAVVDTDWFARTIRQLQISRMRMTRRVGVLKYRENFHTFSTQCMIGRKHCTSGDAQHHKPHAMV
jgi:hypothetical protein